MTLSELQALRIGLVLAGGGAKGAYQVGCWDALRSRGVTGFSSVSGASVGALNAALIATGRYDDAKRFWTTIRRRDVIGLRVMYLAFLPLWTAAAVYRNWFVPVRSPSPSDRAGLRAKALWMLVVWLYTIPEFWPFYKTPEGAPFYQWTTIAIVIGLTFYMFGWLLKWSLLQLPVTSSAPLFQMVLEEFGTADFKAPSIPLFAVVSRFRPEYRESDPYGGWLPDYIRMDALGSRDFVDVLLTSAGLPGIFPPREVLGEEAIDGGWCDNTPLAPLLYADGAVSDLIFVIHLDDQAASNRYRFNEDEWGGEMTGRRLVEENAPIMWKRQSPEKEAWKQGGVTVIKHTRPRPVRDADSAGAETTLPRILHVIPSEPLGGFFNGTLGFSPTRGTELMEMGKRDMNAVLESLLAGESDRYAAEAEPRERTVGRLFRNPFRPVWLRRDEL